MIIISYNNDNDNGDDDDDNGNDNVHTLTTRDCKGPQTSIPKNVRSIKT